MNRFVSMFVTLAVATAANAVVTSTTTHGPLSTSLNSSIKVGDLLSGKIGTELPGDTGWHGAVSDGLDKLPALTDDIGIRATGLTGLLNDFPGAGNPTKIVQYDLGISVNLTSIGILTGNNGRDGRVFSTSVIKYSTNGGSTFDTLGYFQSDPSGTLNNQEPKIGSTYVTIFDNASPLLLANVTNLQFLLYSVDNTGGEMRDPFDGVNPFTGTDDTLGAAFVSPLVFELDAVPEPATVGLLVLGGLLARSRKRA